jgi:hypothetical protein
MENWKSFRFWLMLCVILAAVAWPTMSVYPRLPSDVAANATDGPCAAHCANLPPCGGVPPQCASALGCGFLPALAATPPVIAAKPFHCGPFAAYDEKSSGLSLKPEPPPPNASA